MVEYLKIEYKCKNCGIAKWQGNPIVLELEHIDGNNRNNSIENLELLCPNCHSQTKGFRGRGKNSGKVKVMEKDLKKALMESKNIRQALIKVGLSPKGGNYNRVGVILQKYGIVCSSSPTGMRQTT
jgi:5-methylcytosine-specific restriction endonuclease McrA